MPSYKCVKGCKHPKTRDAITHDARWQCPFEPTYDAERLRNRGFKTPPPESKPVPPVEGVAPAKPSAPAPVPSGPVLRTSALRVAAEGAFAEVQNRTAIQPAPAAAKPDYILDPTYARRAWVLLYGGAEFGANQWGKYWENPKQIDHAIFEFSQAQSVNFESPDSYMCRIPTWVLKQLGCTTLQEAQTMIDDVELVRFVGAPLWGTGEYMYKSYVDSPKLKRAQDEAEKKRLASLAPQKPAGG